MQVVIKLPPEHAARLARAWYAAAESCRQQFPNDHERYNYYINEAKRLEEQANGH